MLIIKTDISDLEIIISKNEINPKINKALNR